jgi:DNA-binding transcriptional LysR family regulator
MATYAFDPRLDLNLFRVLDAIYSHGGISGAARALHLTQPAISHSLGRLRDVFDDPLFVRQGNRMIATERTRAVIADVHQHLQGLFGSAAPAPAFSPDKLDIEFRIALRDVLESTALPLLMQHLGRHAPKVRVACRPVPRENFEREFALGSLDLAIDRRIGAGSQVSRLHLADESVAVVVGRNRVPRGKRRLSAEDYVSARHVVVTHLEGRDPFDSILAETSLRRRVALRCLHYFSACEVVAATDMILTMPRAYAEQLAGVLPIRVLDLPQPMSPIQVFMYWPASRDEDRAHRWLREQIQDLAKRSGWMGASARAETS